MKQHVLALAGALAVAAPVVAQQAAGPNPPQRPERHLVSCGQPAEAERNCLYIRRAFLEQYARAMAGDRASQAAIAMYLSVGARVPGNGMSYVLTDPTEACAWRLVVAGERSDRNDAVAVRSACERLSEDQRAAARERACSAPGF